MLCRGLCERPLVNLAAVSGPASLAQQAGEAPVLQDFSSPQM